MLAIGTTAQAPALADDPLTRFLDRSTGEGRSYARSSNRSDDLGGWSSNSNSNSNSNSSSNSSSNLSSNSSSNSSSMVPASAVKVWYPSQSVSDVRGETEP